VKIQSQWVVTAGNTNNNNNNRCRLLRVIESRVLRRIFGPRGDEVTGEWRKLQDE
jgi:hypothetical protein